VVCLDWCSQYLQVVDPSGFGGLLGSERCLW
jgi:hypothetical protein